MRLAGLLVGVIAILLGGLWLVQGLGLVSIKPIACVAACEALEGPSPVWAVVGMMVLAVGVGLAAYGLQRRKR